MARKQKKPFIPLFLISFIFVLLQSHSVSNAADEETFQALNRKFSLNGILVSQESEKYAVIFDAGSTGSRVHVFRFDKNMDLLRIGNDFEFFNSTKPGLSAYADDPKAAALSLKPLLVQGQAVVPEDLRPHTPIKLGATAGLRMLKNGAADRILEAVRDLFNNESSLEYEAEWVSILDGSQEGSYMWIAMNYMLGKIGKPYSQTIATLDLGGGSVQMTYAISEENAAKAPIPNEGEAYVHEKYLLGKKYYLYAHSYLYYGQLAARAEIFKVTRNSSNPCILDGYDGFYTYGGVVYKASPPRSGSSFKKCREVTLKALKVKAPCNYDKCTFNGTWSGGGGAGQKNVYAASFFFDIAKESGIISADKDVYSGRARPIDYRDAASVACKTKYEDVKSVFPNIYDEDLPYLCMDLVYEYSLLVDGLGLDPYKKITLVNKINYKNTLMGAAWPLGSAIEAVSSLTNWRMFQ
ncbi:hypothetical protein ACH5RR_016019 [Cinchona calisaya]|uniref:Apyrase n=1 Tax=Cinchona calisaya TaxID=153742 RepID=A0ABD2ZY69_9GENT